MKERIVIENKKFIEYFKHTDNDYYEHRVEQVPESIKDVKELLEELKIEHESVYVNDKDFRWTVKDKVKFLRAINIEFKTKFYDSFTKNNITIGNDNNITIRKYKYEGQEFITLQFSTMEQVWNIFMYIYKDVI